MKCAYVSILLLLLTLPACNGDLENQLAEAQQQLALAEGREARAEARAAELRQEIEYLKKITDQKRAENAKRSQELTNKLFSGHNN